MSKTTGSLVIVPPVKRSCKHVSHTSLYINREFGVPISYMQDFFKSSRYYLHMKLHTESRSLEI